MAQLFNSALSFLPFPRGIAKWVDKYRDRKKPGGGNGAAGIFVPAFSTQFV